MHSCQDIEGEKNDDISQNQLFFPTLYISRTKEPLCLKISGYSNDHEAHLWAKSQIEIPFL
jgi:hypothetical protein